MPDETASQPTRRRWQDLMQTLGQLISDQTLSEERHRLIADIDQAILQSTFSADAVFKLIVDKCLQKTGSNHGQIVEYRHNELVVTASTELSRIGNKLPLNESLCGKAVLTQSNQHIPNVKSLSLTEYVRYHDKTESELAILVRASPEGRILAVLDLERDKPGLFDQDSVNFAEVLAGQAAIAIRHAQTWSGVSLLYEINASLLAGGQTLEETFQGILNAILQVFDFQHGQILLVEQDHLVVMASSDEAHIGTMATKENSVCGKYLLAEGKREILIINDIERSEEYSQFYLGLLTAASGRMRSEMVVPLIHSSGLIGALNIEDPRSEIFSDLESNFFPVVGALMASAISAAFTRRTKANEERFQAANLALTELGHETENFVHPFNNRIGSAKAKLIELRDFLTPVPLDQIRHMPVTHFLSDVIANLEDAIGRLNRFREQFNPDSPRYRLKPMNVVQVAKECVERVQHDRAAAKISFDFEDTVNESPGATERLICLLNDAVNEVIESILNNAVEAINDKGSNFSGQIVLTSELPDPFHVRLQIRDNGIGIPEENQDKIFKYKFTTRQDRSSPGRGLWFCDLYMKQRGGSVTLLYSHVGEGSCFELNFPTAHHGALSTV